MLNNAFFCNIHTAPGYTIVQIASKDSATLPLHVFFSDVDEYFQQRRRKGVKKSLQGQTTRKVPETFGYVKNFSLSSSLNLSNIKNIIFLSTDTSSTNLCNIHKLLSFTNKRHMDVMMHPLWLPSNMNAPSPDSAIAALLIHPCAPSFISSSTLTDEESAILFCRSRPFFLFVHSNDRQSDLGWLLPLVRLFSLFTGCPCMIYDVPGVGVSRGRGLVGFHRQVAIVDVILDWLQVRLKMSSEKIFLLGITTGAHVAASAAFKRLKIAGAFGSKSKGLGGVISLFGAGVSSEHDHPEGFVSGCPVLAMGDSDMFDLKIVSDAVTHASNLRLGTALKQTGPSASKAAVQVDVSADSTSTGLGLLAAICQLSANVRINCLSNKIHDFTGIHNKMSGTDFRREICLPVLKFATSVIKVRGIHDIPPIYDDPQKSNIIGVFFKFLENTFDNQLYGLCGLSNSLSDSLSPISHQSLSLNDSLIFKPKSKSALYLPFRRDFGRSLSRPLHSPESIVTLANHAGANRIQLQNSMGDTGINKALSPIAAAHQRQISLIGNFGGIPTNPHDINNMNANQLQQQQPILAKSIFSVVLSGASTWRVRSERDGFQNVLEKVDFGSGAAVETINLPHGCAHNRSDNNASPERRNRCTCEWRIVDTSDFRGRLVVGALEINSGLAVLFIHSESSKQHSGMNAHTSDDDTAVSHNNKQTISVTKNAGINDSASYFGGSIFSAGIGGGSNSFHQQHLQSIIDAGGMQLGPIINNPLNPSRFANCALVTLRVPGVQDIISGAVLVASHNVSDSVNQSAPDGITKNNFLNSQAEPSLIFLKKSTSKNRNFDDSGYWLESYPIKLNDGEWTFSAANVVTIPSPAISKIRAVQVESKQFLAGTDECANSLYLSDSFMKPDSMFPGTFGEDNVDSPTSPVLPGSPQPSNVASALQHKSILTMRIICHPFYPTASSMGVPVLADNASRNVPLVAFRSALHRGTKSSHLLFATSDFVMSIALTKNRSAFATLIASKYDICAGIPISDAAWLDVGSHVTLFTQSGSVYLVGTLPSKLGLSVRNGTMAYFSSEETPPVVALANEYLSTTMVGGGNIDVLSSSSCIIGAVTPLLTNKALLGRGDSVTVLGVLRDRIVVYVDALSVAHSLKSKASLPSSITKSLLMCDNQKQINSGSSNDVDVVGPDSDWIRLVESTSTVEFKLDYDFDSSCRWVLCSIALNESFITATIVRDRLSILTSLSSNSPNMISISNSSGPLIPQASQNSKIGSFVDEDTLDDWQSFACPTVVSISHKNNLIAQAVDMKTNVESDSLDLNENRKNASNSLPEPNQPGHLLLDFASNLVLDPGMLPSTLLNLTGNCWNMTNSALPASNNAISAAYTATETESAINSQQKNPSRAYSLAQQAGFSLEKNLIANSSVSSMRRPRLAVESYAFAISNSNNYPNFNSETAVNASNDQNKLKSAVSCSKTLLLAPRVTASVSSTSSLLNELIKSSSHSSRLIIETQTSVFAIINSCGAIGSSAANESLMSRISGITLRQISSNPEGVILSLFEPPLLSLSNSFLSIRPLDCLYLTLTALKIVLHPRSTSELHPAILIFAKLILKHLPPSFEIGNALLFSSLTLLSSSTANHRSVPLLKPHVRARQTHFNITTEHICSLSPSKHNTFSHSAAARYSISNMQYVNSCFRGRNRPRSSGCLISCASITDLISLLPSVLSSFALPSISDIFPHLSSVSPASSVSIYSHIPFTPATYQPNSYQVAFANAMSHLRHIQGTPLREKGKSIFLSLSVLLSRLNTGGLEGGGRRPSLKSNEEQFNANIRFWLSLHGLDIAASPITGGASEIALSDTISILHNTHHSVEDEDDENESAVVESSEAMNYNRALVGEIRFSPKETNGIYSNSGGKKSLAIPVLPITISKSKNRSTSNKNDSSLDVTNNNSTSVLVRARIIVNANKENINWIGACEQGKPIDQEDSWGSRAVPQCIIRVQPSPSTPKQEGIVTVRVPTDPNFIQYFSLENVLHPTVHTQASNRNGRILNSPNPLPTEPSPLPNSFSKPMTITFWTRVSVTASETSQTPTMFASVGDPSDPHVSLYWSAYTKSVIVQVPSGDPGKSPLTSTISIPSSIMNSIISTHATQCWMLIAMWRSHSENQMSIAALPFVVDSVDGNASASILHDLLSSQTQINAHSTINASSVSNDTVIITSNSDLPSNQHHQHTNPICVSLNIPRPSIESPIAPPQFVSNRNLPTSSLLVNFHSTDSRCSVELASFRVLSCSPSYLLSSKHEHLPRNPNQFDESSSLYVLFQLSRLSCAYAFNMNAVSEEHNDALQLLSAIQQEKSKFVSPLEKTISLKDNVGAPPPLIQNANNFVPVVQPIITNAENEFDDMLFKLDAPPDDVAPDSNHPFTLAGAVTPELPSLTAGIPVSIPVGIAFTKNEADRDKNSPSLWTDQIDPGKRAGSSSVAHRVKQMRSQQEQLGEPKAFGDAASTSFPLALGDLFKNPEFAIGEGDEIGVSLSNAIRSQNTVTASPLSIRNNDNNNNSHVSTVDDLLRINQNQYKQNFRQENEQQQNLVVVNDVQRQINQISSSTELVARPPHQGVTTTSTSVAARIPPPALKNDHAELVAREALNYFQTTLSKPILTGMPALPSPSADTQMILTESRSTLKHQSLVVGSFGLGIGLPHLLLFKPISVPSLQAFHSDSWVSLPSQWHFCLDILSTFDHLLLSATSNIFDMKTTPSHNGDAGCSWPKSFSMAMHATYRGLSLMRYLPRLPPSLLTSESPFHPSFLRARLAIAARLRAVSRALLCLKGCIESRQVFVPSIAMLYLNLVCAEGLLASTVKENLMLVVLGLLLRCNEWECCRVVAEYLILQSKKPPSTESSPPSDLHNNASKKINDFLGLNSSILTNEILATKVSRIHALASSKCKNKMGVVAFSSLSKDKEFDDEKYSTLTLPSCVKCSDLFNPTTGVCSNCQTIHKICWVSLTFIPTTPVKNIRDGSIVSGVTCAGCGAFISEMCRKVLFTKQMNEAVLNQTNSRGGIGMYCPFCAFDGLWRGDNESTTQISSLRSGSIPLPY